MKNSVKKMSKVIYVRDKKGDPLMPTRRTGRVQKLVKDGDAVIVRQDPLTIKLNGETRNYIFLWENGG